MLRRCLRSFNFLVVIVIDIIIIIIIIILSLREKRRALGRETRKLSLFRVSLFSISAAFDFIGSRINNESESDSKYETRQLHGRKIQGRKRERERKREGSSGNERKGFV